MHTPPTEILSNAATNELQLYEHSNLHTIPLTSTPGASAPTSTSEVQIHYVPVESPPTPAASPRPAVSHLYSDLHNAAIHPTLRREYLSAVVSSCTPDELLFLSETIAPLLRRPFKFRLPEELVLHVLGFVDDLPTLMSATLVCKQWHRVVRDESIWQRLCITNDFDDWPDAEREWRLQQKRKLARRGTGHRSREEGSEGSPHPSSPSSAASDIEWSRPFSFRRFFRDSYITNTNWRTGGQLLNTHRLPIIAPDSGTVTSVALDRKWLVVGLANALIKVYRARTGVLVRTLKGHDSGVWGVCLVSGNGETHVSARTTGGGEVDALTAQMAGASLNGGGGTEWQRDGLHVMPGESLAHLLPPAMQRALGIDAALLRRSAAGEDTTGAAAAATQERGAEGASNPCHASQGWGQPNPIIVSGGCDKVIRVWDLRSGQCIYALHGHVSTVRSLRVLRTRPLAVTGSRDATLRVWDVQLGRCVRVLAGHEGSVRCLDVCGNRVVSGSYDTTCRLWDIDTGECLHVLRGHYSQIYSVAFDGVRIASGGLDTCVRIWDAETGRCTALLQGHTALVCQLQLSPTLLATGGADGRVITFALDTLSARARIAAHDSSVTALQLGGPLLVTGGNDGRVRVFDVRTGNFVRELGPPGECVWKVVFAGAACAVLGRRAGRTVVEIWSMRPNHVRAPPPRARGRARREEGAAGGVSAR